MALSGGVDSSVLLALACNYLLSVDIPSPKPLIKALHIHHGLSRNADAWVTHCQQLCDQYQVELTVEYADIDSKGNVELQARAARYRVFEQHIAEGELLLQGHHLNDQAETFIFRAIRGSGVRGLAAIPSMRALGRGMLLRPLIAVKRDAIVNFAMLSGLSWIEDESNQDTAFDRNFIRHKILPELASRWPSVLERIAKSAAYCHEADELNDELAKIDLLTSQVSVTPFAASLDRQRLTELSFLRQKNLIRYWLSHIGLGFPGEKGFQAIWSDLLTAREGAVPMIRCPNGCLRSDQMSLFAIDDGNGEIDSLSEHGNPEFEVDLRIIEDGFQLPLSLGELYFYRSDTPSGTLSDTLFNGGRDDPLTGRVLFIPDNAGTFLLRVRIRQGGERMKVAGESVTRSLKTLFQQAKIPVWERHRAPLIFNEHKLLAIADRLVAEGSGWMPLSKSDRLGDQPYSGWLIQWRPDKTV